LRDWRVSFKIIDELAQYRQEVVLGAVAPVPPSLQKGVYVLGPEAQRVELGEEAAQDGPIGAVSGLGPLSPDVF